MSALASDSRSQRLGVSKELRAATVDALWRQWSTLGASAASAAGAQAVIDPEAAVLASLCFVDDEPRLADVVAQWSLLNGAILSVQRIKNLSAAFPGAATGLAEFAQLMSDEGNDARWKSLVQADVPALAYRHGRSRTVRVPFERPPCLLLRLRVLFGVGVKADAVAFLLSQRRPNVYIDPIVIARAIAYDVASVRRVLTALADAGWLYHASDAPSGFSSEGSALEQFVGATIPAWRYCAGLFSMVVDLLALTDRVPPRATDYAMDTALEQFLDAHRLVFVDNGLTQAHRDPIVESFALLKSAVTLIHEQV
jgi:hypothetical protein